MGPQSASQLEAIIPVGIAEQMFETTNQLLVNLTSWEIQWLTSHPFLEGTHKLLQTWGGL